MEDDLKQTMTGYDEEAEDYTESWRGQLNEDLIESHQRFLDYLDENRNGDLRILDVGTGTGKDPRYLSQFVDEVVGVDLSGGMLEQAQEDVGDEVELLRNDMRNLSFQDNAFDGVLTNTSTVHVNSEGKAEALEEMNRVLKDDGVLHAVVQNLASFPHIEYGVSALTTPPWKKEELGHAIDYDRHWYFPTKGSYEDAIEDAGFEILDSNSYFSRFIDVYAVNR